MKKKLKKIEGKIITLSKKIQTKLKKQKKNYLLEGFTIVKLYLVQSIQKAKNKLPNFAKIVSKNYQKWENII